jgi:hypothetical protein
MATNEESPLDLPQIKSVLEKSSKTIFSDWLSKTKSPETQLNEATVLISEKLNQIVLEECPSVAEHKVVVVGFATEQVTILWKKRYHHFEIQLKLKFTHSNINRELKNSIYE